MTTLAQVAVKSQHQRNAEQEDAPTLSGPRTAMRTAMFGVGGGHDEASLYESEEEARRDQPEFGVVTDHHAPMAPFNRPRAPTSLHLPRFERMRR